MLPAGRRPPKSPERATGGAGTKPWGTSKGDEQDQLRWNPLSASSELTAMAETLSREVDTFFSNLRAGDAEDRLSGGRMAEDITASQHA
jgi:hypothetical protein